MKLTKKEIIDIIYTLFFVIVALAVLNQIFTPSLKVIGEKIALSMYEFIYGK